MSTWGVSARGDLPERRLSAQGEGCLPRGFLPWVCLHRMGCFCLGGLGGQEGVCPVGGVCLGGCLRGVSAQGVNECLPRGRHCHVTSDCPKDCLDTSPCGQNS